jgi:hypothetical protein
MCSAASTEYGWWPVHVRSAEHCGIKRNAVPRLRTRWCSMLIAKAFRHLARRTSSLLAILAITALHPFTVNFTGTTHQRPPKRPLASTPGRRSTTRALHERHQCQPAINDFIMLTPREPFEFDSEAGSSDDASQ